MHEALQTLPCVEDGSVEADAGAKAARFAFKKDARCRVDAVRKAVSDAGFRVSAVRVEVREATVVAAGAGGVTLLLKGDDRKHAYDVGKGVAISLDGKPAQLADLKKDYPTNVTTDERFVITKIEARSRGK